MTALHATLSISISPPEEHELRPRGLTLDHVHHAYVEVARQILAKGGSLAYGGNPGAGKPNYVQILLALLHAYSKPDRPSRERIHIYLGAPLWVGKPAEERAAMNALAEVHKVPPAGDEPDWARDFTPMREQMLAETDGRILIGGRTVRPYAGIWPGVVEEAYLTVRDAKPLYVAGGLGGGAGLVADLIRGRDRADVELADRDVLVATFTGADLHNGLTADENELLFDTADLDLIVALILRGLERWCAHPSS